MVVLLLLVVLLRLVLVLLLLLLLVVVLLLLLLLPMLLHAIHKAVDVAPLLQWRLLLQWLVTEAHDGGSTEI